MDSYELEGYDDIVGVWRKIDVPGKVETQSNNYDLAVEAFLKMLAEELGPNRQPEYPDNFRAIWVRGDKRYVVAEFTIYDRQDVPEAPMTPREIEEAENE